MLKLKMCMLLVFGVRKLESIFRVVDLFVLLGLRRLMIFFWLMWKFKLFIIVWLEKCLFSLFMLIMVLLEVELFVVMCRGLYECGRLLGVIGWFF